MNDEDYFETLSQLPSSTGYTPKDRYHDFRQLFMGSDQGKRVLGEILSWGRLFRPSALGSPVDPNLTHIREGERNLCLRLLHTVHNEPPEPQTKAKRKR